MTEPDLPYLRALRGELVAGMAAARRRRRRRSLTVAAVLAVVATAGALIVGPEGDIEPALAIDRGPHTIVLRLVDADPDLGQLTRELQAAGLRARVVAVPSSPSLVGAWAGFEQRPTGGDEPAADYEEALRRDRADTERLERVEVTPTRLTLPVRALRATSGDLTFMVGRTTPTGSLPAVAASAVAPGEPLHCTGIERLTPARAARALRQRGYVAVFPEAGPDGQPSTDPPTAHITHIQLAASSAPAVPEETFTRRSEQVFVYTTIGRSGRALGRSAAQRSAGC